MAFVRRFSSEGIAYFQLFLQTCWSKY